MKMEITRTVTLMDLYDAILDHAAKDAEVGAFCRNEIDYCRNSIFYEEEEQFYIEGSYTACGCYEESGDGYWVPRETNLTNVTVSINKLDVWAYNPETEDYDIAVDEKQVDHLSEYLEKYLPGMLEY